MKMIRIMALPLLLAMYGSAWGGIEEGFTAVSRGDYATAIREWRPLAEQGDANAQHNLGVIYEYGYGVPVDYKEAMNWYLKAAEQGLAASQYNLGVMYNNGEGVTRNYVQAHKWFNIAGEHGIKDISQNLEVVARKMTPAQISEAQSLAREWLRKHPRR